MSATPVTVVRAGDSARDAFLDITDRPAGLAAVVDDGGTLVGTVSDGDLRRAVLDGAGLEVPVSEVMSSEILTVAPGASGDEVRALLESARVEAAIVVDGGRAVGLRTRADAGLVAPPATAVVLAGGRGQRLRPLTDKVPKPLLMVGRTTIVERLVEALAASGVEEVFLSVNYKAELFENRLGDGSAYGVRLHYLRERKELHTAGPLRLLPHLPAGPLVVTNADQVTALQFTRMVDYHRREGAALTVGAFTYEKTVPYGVLRLEGRQVRGIDEKPIRRHLCNAGVYVLEPELVDLVPPNTFFGMPELLQAVVASGRPVAAFPIIETFIDIGTRDELDRALLYFATGEEV